MLKFTERTNLIGFIGGFIRQEPFWLLGAITGGKGNFFLFSKFGRQLAVEPGLHVEEGIIQHFLGGLRVTVDFPHERFNQSQF